jgi:hypothetical protein
MTPVDFVDREVPAVGRVGVSVYEHKRGHRHGDSFDRKRHRSTRISASHFGSLTIKS